MRIGELLEHDSRMTERAREFRKEPTPSESLLWEALRKGRLDGRRFRQQQPIGPFIVDFYCSSEKLVAEVDGPIHEQQAERDAERQTLLETTGLRVIRLSSAAVEQNLPLVLETIRQSFLSSLAPAPLVGEGVGEGG